MKPKSQKNVWTGRVEGGANQNTLYAWWQQIEKPREVKRERVCVSNSEANKNKAVRAGVANLPAVRKRVEGENSRGEVRRWEWGSDDRQGWGRDQRPVGSVCGNWGEGWFGLGNRGEGRVLGAVRRRNGAAAMGGGRSDCPTARRQRYIKAKHKVFSQITLRPISLSLLGILTGGVGGDTRFRTVNTRSDLQPTLVNDTIGETSQTGSNSSCLLTTLGTAPQRSHQNSSDF